MRRTRRGLAVALGGIAAAWGVARATGAFRFTVEGDSMSPTLEHGQFVVASRAGSHLRRGDVVVARLGELEVVKRIVGLPGERVTLAGGRVEVDGHPLREPYARGAGAPGAWDLGEGEYLLLGDNRERSTDAREFGPLPRGTIAGVVRFRYWPRMELVR